MDECKGLVKFHNDEAIVADEIKADKPFTVASDCAIVAKKMTAGIAIFTRCAVTIESFELVPYDFDLLVDQMGPYERMIYLTMARSLGEYTDIKLNKSPGILFCGSTAIINRVVPAYEMSGAVPSFVHSDEVSRLEIGVWESILMDEKTRSMATIWSPLAAGQ